MTKRYARLNWQNKPSVATPLNATNLNRMDKGIDDLDLYKIDVDAIVNNGVTTTTGTVLDGRMGKTLQDQVATINNNLANMTLSFATTADTAYILRLPHGRVCILTSLDANAGYQCAYLLVRASSTVSYIVPLKSATGATVTADGSDFIITTTAYGIKFLLFDMTRFRD